MKADSILSLLNPRQGPELAMSGLGAKTLILKVYFHPGLPGSRQHSSHGRCCPAKAGRSA